MARKLANRLRRWRPRVRRTSAQVLEHRSLLFESLEDRRLLATDALTFQLDPNLGATAYIPGTGLQGSESVVVSAAKGSGPTSGDGSGSSSVSVGGAKNGLSDAQRAAIEQVVRDSTDKIWFENNVGQFPEGVQYGFRTTFGSMLVYEDHLRLISRQSDEATQTDGQQIVDLRFAGSHASWHVEPGENMGVIGSYQQADGASLRPDIFDELTLRNVYDGVDLRLYSAERGILEFDWIVARAQDYGQIRIVADGQDGIVFHDDGSATLDLRFQDLTMRIPESYQVIEGVKHPIEARMVAGETAGEIRYALTGDLVPDQPLVIDPNMAWSTFFDLNSTSTNFDAYLYAIAANSNGVYALGWARETITNATFGPGGNNYMQVNAGFTQGTAANQAYIYRLDSTGTNITAWTSTGITVSTSSTTTNQSLINMASDLHLLPDGRVLAGFTGGRLQIYSANLAAQQYSNIPVSLGANGALNGIAVVSNDVFYISGRTNSPLSGAGSTGPDATTSGYEGFIIRLSGASTASGTAGLTADWFTYVGGSGDEWSTVVEATPDGSKIVFATSTTVGTDYPALVNAVDSTIAGTTELLVGVLPDQATAPTDFDVFSYLGGSASEGTANASAIAQVIASNTYFWVGGTTNSTDLPGTAGGAQSTFGGGTSDIFLSRIPLNGSASAGFRSTYAGGSGQDRIGGIAYDSRADRVLFFSTTTGSFPTQDTTPPQFVL